jgi:hypothetical protein
MGNGAKRGEKRLKLRAEIGPQRKLLWRTYGAYEALSQTFPALTGWAKL